MAFLVYGLNNPFKFKEGEIFIKLVVVLSFVQLTLSFVKDEEFILDFFRIKEYYSAKGIETNINGGIRGIRLLFPFYSTGLLGTFFGLLIIKSLLRRWRLLTVVLGLFTMSKAVVVLPVLNYLKKYRIGLLAFIVSVFAVLPLIIGYVLDSMETGIITFHAASIRDRFNILPLLWSELQNFRIGQLGSNSVAGYILQGKDASKAPESLIVARLMDYSFAAPILFFQVVLLYLSCNRNNQGKFLMIITLFMFTSLSNHPIAFVPLLLDFKND
ncbi:hypothetical protein N9D13_00500 [Schleiferiaceae bacterium]|nr:hypothetical protein [Schleiferiaceae bacterium]